MHRLSGLLLRLRRAARRRSADAQLLAEMRDHLERETARRIANGEDPATARRRAAAAFGSVDARTEEVRENRLGSWLAQLTQDLAYAWRILRKSPGFAFVAIATLAIGIGANSAIFSAVDAVLFRPLPYPNPGQLVNVFEALPNGGQNSVSGGSFRDWQDHQTQFDALALTANDQFDLSGFGQPEKINALSVTADFGQVFGLPLLRGRDFTADDTRVGGQNHVVILSENFWRTRYGADDNAIGRTLMIDGNPHEIIGVAPAGIWHQRWVQIFVPYVLVPNSYLTSHEVHRAQVVGRLKPGVTLASAVAELNAIKHNLSDTYPRWKDTWSVGAEPLHSSLARDSKPFLLMLLGATALVLLIACANVANLLLARATVRRREIALRAALGASARRIVRQLLTESVLLALLGGLGGVLIAAASVRLLGSLSAGLLPATMMPELDLRVLAFSLFASGVTGLAFGLLPALRSRRPDLNHALKSGSTGATDGGRNRSQSSLVVAEVALTAVLLIATGLLVRGMVRSVSADPGIDPQNILTFELTPPYGGTYGNPQTRLAFFERALTELRALPGVISAASTDDLPYGGDGQGYYFSLEEQPETRQDRTGRIKYVSEDYFATLGARILRGRAITAQDNREGAPNVMIINQVMAGQLFAADENPLGRLINVGDQPWEVIGVVADMRIDQLHAPPKPMFFVPHCKFPWGSAFMIRTQGDPAALADAAAAAIHRINPNFPLVNLRTVEDAMAEALGPQQVMLNLIAAFAAVALVLAGIGLYGVMAYAVTNRRRELSIRVALGATRHDVMRLIMNQGARLLGIGLTAGLLAGYTTARIVASRMTEVTAGDPLVFVIAALLLAAVTALACWLPARRAAKSDPIQALRSE